MVSAFSSPIVTHFIVSVCHASKPDRREEWLNKGEAQEGTLSFLASAQGSKEHQLVVAYFLLFGASKFLATIPTP